MKGLIIKDYCLMLQQKTSMLFMLALAVVFNFSMEGTFGAGYLTMVAVMMVIGTLSYDEFDNGYPFLMTLPVSRREYVRAKYVFALSFCGAAWLAGLALYVLSGMITEGRVNLPERIAETAVFIPMVLIFLSVVFPLQFKFGTEKGKIVTLCFLGAIVAAIFVGATSDTFRNIAGEMLDGAGSTVNLTAVLIAVPAVSLAAIFISYGISSRIMEKKDF